MFVYSQKTILDRHEIMTKTITKRSYIVILKDKEGLVWGYSRGG
jgi:hypothetical protein